MPNPVKKNCLTALGIHIFAGGFTLGVKAAGFDVLAHLEDTPYGVETAKKNFPDLDVRVGDREWREGEFAGRVDLLYSNPPCAIFSLAGISTTRGPDAWREDPRLGCWYRAWRVFEVVRPRVFALESVCQAYTKGREVVDDFTWRALGLGYSVIHLMVDAKWCGLPQSRKRFFFVVHRPELPLQFSFDWREPPTVSEVLAAVRHPGHVTGHDTGANFAQWISATPPGGKLRAAYDLANPLPEVNVGGKRKGRPGFMYSRLPRDTTMGAFTGDLFAHPTEDRFIGTSEMRALCGYPYDFWLEGRPRQHAGFLARAVLPPVGRWLASSVASGVTDLPVGDGQTVTCVDLRRPPGAAEDLTGEYRQHRPANPLPSTTVMAASSLTAHRHWPRLLLTGSSPVQCGSTKTQLGIVTAASCWREAATRLGYEVDWRAVTPGEDVSWYDAVVVSLNGPNKISSGYFSGAAWALSQRPDAVVALDDWQVGELISGLRTCARSRERLFRLRGDPGGDAGDAIYGTVVELTRGDWKFPVVVPVLGDGDPSLLGVPGKVVPVDPTAFARRYPRPDQPLSRERKWVQASLLRKDVPRLGWPVAVYGNSDKGEGGIGRAGAGAQPRVREAELMDAYCSAWGVLSPAHPHAGSGWWRVRYLMAADAGCVLSADPREAACLGEPYVRASDPAAVERLSDGMLRRWALDQRRRLAEVTWPRERVLETLKDLMGRTACRK